MPLIASAVIGGVSSLFKIGGGISQLSKAKKLERNNPRPVFEIQKEYFNNQSLSQNMAQRGLTDKALDYYTTEAQRGFSSGTDTALQLGGSVNSVNALYDTYQRGLQEIAAKDAELQTQNIRYLIDRNKDLAAQKTQQWVLNKYEPYKDKARAAAQARAAGMQNINAGLSEGMGVATSLYTAGQNEEVLKLGQQQVQQQQQQANNATRQAVNNGGYESSNMFGQFVQFQQEQPQSQPVVPVQRTYTQAELDQMRINNARNSFNYKDMSVEDMYNMQYGYNF